MIIINCNISIGHYLSLWTSMAIIQGNIGKSWKYMVTQVEIFHSHIVWKRQMLILHILSV